MKFDDVLKHIGEFGPYQRRVFFFTALPSLLSAFEAMSVIFTFNIPNHRCAIPGYEDDQFHMTNMTHALLLNHSIPWEDNEMSQCYMYKNFNYDSFISELVRKDQVNGSGTTPSGRENRPHDGNTSDTTSCERWVFDNSVFETTISSEFDVVCDRSVQRASSNLIAEMGCVFGTFVCGFTADKLGRKIPFYISALAMIGGGFGMAFTTNLITLNVCRFIIGVARLSLWVNGIVISMELVGPSWRVLVGILLEMFWCLGMLLLLVFVYFVRNWRYLEIAISVPSIGLLAYWWLIPESPRWLASKGREDEAIQVLEKIAASNKTKLPKMEDFSQFLETEVTLTFRHVFKSRELIVRMLILFSNMFVLCVIYYALAFNVTNLAGDIFLNYLISAVLETAGYAAPYFLLDRLGRKPVYCVSILVAGVACVMAVVPEVVGAPDWVVVALSMVGRFFVCICYGVVYIYGPELFPTVIRGSAMGIGVTFSRFGGLAYPYLADLGILVGGRLKAALPLIVMGSPALVVGIFSLWLPETKGIKLPETFEDLKETRSKRCCICCGQRRDVEEMHDINDDHMITSSC